MEKGDKKDRGKNNSAGKGSGSAKRNKIKELKIHNKIPIPPKIIPEGSIFKGYKNFVTQEIIIEPNNTLYLL